MPLTVRHLLIECPSLSEERDIHFHSSSRGADGSFSLAKILGANFNENCLFNFIDAIGILSQI